MWYIARSGISISLSELYDTLGNEVAGMNTMHFKSYDGISATEYTNCFYNYSCATFTDMDGF